MKNLVLLIFILFSLSFIFSCKTQNRKIEEIGCVVIKTSEIKKQSVHDDINPTKYKVYTDCGQYFIGYKKYEKGDSVTIRLVTYH